MKPTHSRNLTVAVFVSAVVLFLHFAKLSPTFAADGTDAQWDGAVQASRHAGKPTLVVFAAASCTSGLDLQAEFRRREVADELEHYFVYTVDMTGATPEALNHANQFNIDELPQLIRFDTDQQETGRTQPLPPQQFAEWLKAGR
jgi:hypothetical protein